MLANRQHRPMNSVGTENYDMKQTAQLFSNRQFQECNVGNWSPKIS